VEGRGQGSPSSEATTIEDVPECEDVDSGDEGDDCFEAEREDEDGAKDEKVRDFVVARQDRDLTDLLPIPDQQKPTPKLPDFVYPGPTPREAAILKKYGFDFPTSVPSTLSSPSSGPNGEVLKPKPPVAPEPLPLESVDGGTDAWAEFAQQQPHQVDGNEVDEFRVIEGYGFRLILANIARIDAENGFGDDICEQSWLFGPGPEAFRDVAGMIGVSCGC
jgi:hypothetical protein